MCSLDRGGAISEPCQFVFCILDRRWVSLAVGPGASCLKVVPVAYMYPIYPDLCLPGRCWCIPKHIYCMFLPDTSDTSDSDLWRIKLHQRHTTRGSVGAWIMSNVWAYRQPVPDLGSNTFCVCFSLPGCWVSTFLHFCTFSAIGSIVAGKLNREQLKYLKWFRIVFEPRSGLSEYNTRWDVYKLSVTPTPPESSPLTPRILPPHPLSPPLCAWSDWPAGVLEEGG